MPPRLPLSLATRQTAKTSSSTLAHVLRLVHNGYLDNNTARSSLARAVVPAASAGRLAAIRQYSSTAIGQRPQKHFSGIQSRRRITSPPTSVVPPTYSSSAAQTVDHDPQYHHPHASTSYAHTYQSDRRHSPPRSPLALNKRFFRAPYHPDAWACLPEQVYTRLKSGQIQTAAEFAGEFDEQGLNGRQVGAVGNLARVFDLFRSTAEFDDWQWLDGKLAEFLDVDPSSVSQIAAPHLASCIRAYAMVQSGKEYKVKALLDQAIAAAHPRDTHSLSHAIAAIAYARVGAWEEAVTEMVRSVNRTVSRISTKNQLRHSYPTLDLALLQEYEKVVLNADRNEDLVSLLQQGSIEFRHLLITSTKENTVTPPPKLLTSICFAALRRIQNPVAWWVEQYEKDSCSRTRWIGSLIFIAISRNRDNIQKATEMLDALLDRGVRVPGEAAIELCSNLSFESPSDARTWLSRVRKDISDLSHSALFRGMLLAQRREWVEEEQELYDEICQRFRPVWRDTSSLATTHAYYGKADKTIAALKSRVGEDFEQYPDALEIVFNAHINANDAEAAEAVLAQINAIQPRLYPYNALLNLYADQVNVTAAMALFDELLDSGVQPNIASYTSLISLFAHRRDPVNANNVFRAMIDAGIEPDPVAHAAIINAEAESGQWVAAAKRWMKLPPDVRKHRSVTSAILKALVLLPAPTEQVIAIFRTISRPTTRSWALAILSASDSGNMDLARDLYEEMDSTARAGFGPPPDAFTFSILLHGYMREGDGTSARLVYDELLKRNILPTSITYGMIVASFTAARGEQSLEQAHNFATSIHAQAKAGAIGDRRHFRATSNHNLFSPLVVAHGRAQNWDAAHMYYDLASDGGKESSVLMYSQLMDVYRRAGEVDNVFETWKKAFQYALDTTSFRKPDPDNDDPALVSSIKPSRSNDNVLCIPLSIVLDSLSTVGRYDDVRKVWSDVEQAGFGFDAGAYNHLCVALARTGDVEGSFMVAQDILLKRFDEVKHRHHHAVRETDNHELPPLSEINVMPSAAASAVERELEEQNRDVSEEDIEEWATEMDIADLPVEPTFSPPNRRSQFHQRSPITREALDSTDESDASFFSSELLKTWRPTDSLWRPSLLTVSVLDHAYSQIEVARTRRSWVPLASPEENDDDQQEKEGDEHLRRQAGMSLPLFGGVPVRNHKTGKPTTQQPRTYLKALNKKYMKVVALIMFHRRRRQAERIKAERNR